ncbi:hypothetical protein JR316_0005426 [Psilocybe cubensis]|uniref:Uncharacterized protein n=1 Tax=Psilocybe cubensis TaxID=181762 RepID=A0ACB8H822_PSICU|nr:hypothetical protein JR316_0005426 [Psilocybe cubensis]KAH9483320.1 hypothetical protein JR316_0005426 [Psilocybe cubensis]
MEAMRQNLDTNIAVDPNRWRADAQIAALRDRKKKMNAKSFNPHHTVRNENQGETDQEDVQFELEQARKKKFNQHVTVAQDGDEPGLVSPSESDDTEDDEDDFHEDDEVDNEGHGHGNGRRHRRPHPLRRPHFEEEKDDEDDEEDQAKLCTPTHNLTLIRTAAELIELDVKLRSTHPGLKIPSLPIDPAGLPLAQQKKGKEKKRKSTFLNTLSRLASPGGGKGMGMSMGIGIGKKGGNTPLVMAPAK